MAAYLTVEEFKMLSLMPASFVDAVEAGHPGFVALRLELKSAYIDSRLRKRYAAPFQLPAPIVVRGWLAALVTVDVETKRGIDPESGNIDEYRTEAKTALDEIKEAADAETGLFDLPLRSDGSSASGVSLGGPRTYTEASPYVFADVQRETAREEDFIREGNTRR
jgi:hypothetical protein